MANVLEKRLCLTLYPGTPKSFNEGFHKALCRIFQGFPQIKYRRYSLMFEVSGYCRAWLGLRRGVFGFEGFGMNLLRLARQPYIVWS